MSEKIQTPEIRPEYLDRNDGHVYRADNDEQAEFYAVYMRPDSWDPPIMFKTRKQAEAYLEAPYPIRAPYDAMVDFLTRMEKRA